MYSFVCILLLVAAFVLRFARLGGASLWIDEAFVGWFTDHTWSGLLYTLHLDGGNLPAHFLIVKLITGALGTSELSVRLFSALCGVAAVLLAMILGRMVGDKPGSLAAGWLWTFSPMAIWYARMPSPMPSAPQWRWRCSSSMSAISGSRIGLCAAGVCATGGRLVQPLLFLPGHHGVNLAGAGRNAQTASLFRKWFLLSLLALAPLAGWLAWFFSQPNPAVGIGWIERPGLSDIPQTAWNLLSGYGGELAFQTTLFGVTVLALTGVGIFSGKGLTLSRLSFVMGVLAPIVAVWAISQRRPIYMDRYFIVLLPFATIPLSVEPNGPGGSWCKKHPLDPTRSWQERRWQD